MSTPLTPEQQKQVDALIFGRQKIEAIKVYRELTSTGLAEAKTAIDAREEELRQQSPQSFPAKSGCASMILLTIAVFVPLAVLAWFTAGAFNR